MHKFGTIMFSLVLLCFGGYMAAMPEAFDFAAASSSGARGLFKSLFATVSDTIGVRPLGFIMGGLGALWLLVSVKPAKHANA